MPKQTKQVRTQLFESKAVSILEIYFFNTILGVGEAVLSQSGRNQLYEALESLIIITFMLSGTSFVEIAH